MLNATREAVRGFMRQIAMILNRLTKGRVTPNQITVTAAIMHIPIMAAIMTGRFVIAAIMLVVFGLLDTLDGQLARLQKTGVPFGQVLDSVTDRFKEALIYIGFAYFFAINNEVLAVVLSTIAISGSMLTSYVSARGDAVIARQPKAGRIQGNRVFRTGIMSYEIRMAVLVVGLAFSLPEIAVAVIAVLSWTTASQRLLLVFNKLIVSNQRQ